MIILTHKELGWVRQLLDLTQVKSIDDLIKAIIRAADALPYMEEGKKLKGDAFEVFVEYFMKKFESSNDVGVTDYGPAQIKEDLGVDGEGVGFDGTPATIQCKFKSNPTEDVAYDEVCKFFAYSILEYQVALGSMNNLLVISTAYKATEPVQKVFLSRGLRFIGYNELIRIIGVVNPKFWDGFREALQNSQVPQKRIERPRYSHQLEINEKIQVFLNGDKKRGWVGCGTGGGKTLSMYDTIEYYFSIGGRVVIYASPRLPLTEQNKKEIHANKKIDYVRLTFDSFGRENVPQFEGEVKEDRKSTTKIDDIVRELGVHSQEKVVIFTTYHSTLKLFEALKQAGVVQFLYLGDECHNLVPPEFSAILNADSYMDRFIGFTGTGRSTRDPNGPGMNNVTRWGVPIIEVPPARLASDGITLPPRGYFLFIEDNADAEALEIDIVNKGIRRFKDEVYPDQLCKIIVTCSSVAMAHKMADEDVLKELPEFKKFVITSDVERMKGRKREGEIESFSKTDNAIIFHYDMIGEGINVPSVSATLLLRCLSPIKCIQNISRANRVLESDRGKIVFNREDWDKPYAWVICPYIRRDPKSCNSYNNFLYLLSEMRKQDPNFLVEDYTFVADSVGEPPDDEVEPYSRRKKEIEDKLILDIEYLQEEEAKALEMLLKRSAHELAVVDISLTEEEVAQMTSPPEQDF